MFNFFRPTSCGLRLKSRRWTENHLLFPLLAISQSRRQKDDFRPKSILAKKPRQHEIPRPNISTRNDPSTRHQRIPENHRLQMARGQRESIRPQTHRKARSPVRQGEYMGCNPQRRQLCYVRHRLLVLPVVWPSGLTLQLLHGRRLLHSHHR